MKKLTRGADPKLEQRILQELIDLVMSLRLYMHNHPVANRGEIKACVRSVRARMKETRSIRIALDLEVSKKPLVMLNAIVEKYIGKFDEEAFHVNRDNSSERQLDNQTGPVTDKVQSFD